MSKSTINLEEKLRQSSSQIDELQRENAKVVEQLKEVIKMNTHWQRYDSQREEYVLKLTKTNQELQEKVSDLQRQVRELTMAKGIDIKKDKPKPEPEELHAAPKESGADVDLKTLREQEMTTLTAKLKERIFELEKAREPLKKADDDELTLLREQVNVCITDFKQERKDRERIHGENERLRERLSDAEKRIRENKERMRVYEEQIKRLQERRADRSAVKPPQGNGYDEPCCYPEDRPHIYRAHYAYRHPMYFGDDLTDLPRDVEVDDFRGEQQNHADDNMKAITTDAVDNES